MIPFNRPGRVGRELDYVNEAIAAGAIGGNGEFTAKCQAFLERELEVKKALLTTSCTAALEMAALLLDIGQGDEVIIPSFTFPSTANAFALRGAKPVFADIRSDTLNIDETQLERHITARTKAIVLMHYAGVGCEIEVIVDLARDRSVPVIEDNAHGLFGEYKGKYLGTFGCMAAQSFHETKNFTCGEAGALLINDETLIPRAEIIRAKGTDRARFYRGEVDKYSWVDLGSSYAPSDILAAFLFGQLEARDKIQSRRQHIWNYYAEHLRAWAQRCEVHLPSAPSYTEHPHHMFFVVMETAEQRTRLITHMQNAGVQTAFHYVPLHLSKMGRSFGGKEGDCPVSESVSGRLLRLPFYNDLTNAELDHVIAALKKFRP
ncbi:MAG: dTDP-4-amino-4,6-dideoxygalactose transaminase [Spartobacteria bacterium]